MHIGFSNLFILIVISFLFSFSVKAEDVNTALKEAQFYFLIDADTNEVLLAKNPDIPVAPSSMTKLMTAFVVFDQIKNKQISFANQCLIGKDAWRKSGSSMFLNYGDVVSIEDLVKGLLVVSGNDAAIALAETSAGGIDNFIALMNSKAKELGLKNSHFQNPHGLNEEGHYMSLRDLAKLAIRLYQDFPQYTHYLGIPEFTYGKITQRNRNPLIIESYDGAIGGKTGHTNQGGYGVVGIVKRDNRLLVAVVNKAKTPKQRSAAIIELFNYGFLNYKKLKLFDKNQTVAHLKTWLGEKDFIEVVTDQEIAFNVPRDQPIESVEVKVKYLSPLYTPIDKGVKVAKLIVEVKDYKTFEYPLFTKEKIDKAARLERILRILSHKFQGLSNQFF